VGRLLSLQPCPVCNYHIEDYLYFGGSVRSRLFIYYRYALGHCRDCHHIVSVLLPTPEYDIPRLLAAAQEQLAAAQERVTQGEDAARWLVRLLQDALEPDDDDQPVETGRCTYCHSENVEVFAYLGGDNGEHFDDGTAWVDCPRCEEGKLLIQTAGWWDEFSPTP